MAEGLQVTFHNKNIKQRQTYIWSYSHASKEVASYINTWRYTHKHTIDTSRATRLLQTHLHSKPVLNSTISITSTTHKRKEYTYMQGTHTYTNIHIHTRIQAYMHTCIVDYMHTYSMPHKVLNISWYFEETISDYHLLNIIVLCSQ